MRKGYKHIMENSYGKWEIVGDVKKDKFGLYIEVSVVLNEGKKPQTLIFTPTGQSRRGA